jgi:protein gp37
LNGSILRHMINSHISWTDHTWNIARGCTKVDADCKYCYMYRESFDNSRYDPLEVVRTKTVFNLPLTIKEPSRIFTCSLTDFFHPAIDSYRHEAWDIIKKCPQHTFQILTKRPERIMQCLPADFDTSAYSHCWFGTSVGSYEGKSRMFNLKRLPISNLKFIPFEPLYELLYVKLHTPAILATFSWVIIGGESGNDTGKYKYRPCRLEWVDDIIETFKDVNVPIFVKQLGTHLAKEMKLKDRHGRDINEWPEKYQIQQFPKP